MRPETPLVQWNHHNTIELQKGALQISWLLYQILSVQGAFQGTSIGSGKSHPASKSTAVGTAIANSHYRTCCLFALKLNIPGVLFVARRPSFTMTSSTTQTFAAVINVAITLSAFPKPSKLKNLLQPMFLAKPISNGCVTLYTWC